MCDARERRDAIAVAIGKVCVRARMRPCVRMHRENDTRMRDVRGRL